MVFNCKPKIVLTDKQKNLIEKIGITFEGEGLQPVAARILGLLYVSDNPQLTFDEITVALQISKSATSNGINLLLQMQRLEYITFSGDRRRYFRLKVSNWREQFRHKIEVMAGINVLMREVLAIRTKETPEYNASIKEMVDFMDYIFQQLPLLLQQWNKEKNNKN